MTTGLLSHPAYFAIFALLAEYSRGKPGSGFTLDRPWPDVNSEGSKNAEQDVKKGKLKLYNDITKRWLGQFVRRVFKA